MLDRTAWRFIDPPGDMDKLGREGGHMNKDELKGKAENLKGRLKEALGSLTGDKRKQAEGSVDRMRGAAREKLGEGEEKVEEMGESVSEAARDASSEREEDDDE
ncbi:MAG TPA: CsbD family protein [Polyangia bacterium]|nr:CsbD family protein [Polyangia bacterium]